VLIVVLVIENPFHALVRNTSCNGRLTQQVIVRLAVTILQAIYDEEIAGGILVTDVPGSKKVVPKGLRGPIVRDSGETNKDASSFLKLRRVGCESEVWR